MNHYLNKHPWQAILVTFAVIITIREGCFYVAKQLNHEAAGNVAGMLLLLVILLLWRINHGLPDWLITASNKILTDSAIAYLPVSAGAGLLLFGLGDELFGILAVTVVATLLPLWAFAVVANRWLNEDKL